MTHPRSLALSAMLTLVLAAGMAAPAPARAADTTDSVGVADRTTGIWYLRGPDGGTTSFYFGDPGDYPIMGDWDCDGVDTPGLYRQSDGYVYLRNANTQGTADVRFFFGDPGDVPLAGDFDGDGCDTVSLYRPSQARIYVINELGANDGGLGAADFTFLFGNPGDRAFTGDFDDDGRDTVGLHRESTGFVYYRNSLTTGVADNDFFFGDPGDQILSGRWAQNATPGPDTVGIFRPSQGRFYLRFSNSQGNADTAFSYGNANMRAVAGSFGSLQGGSAPPPGTTGPGDGEFWEPSAGLTWQWQLTGTIDTTVDAQVFNIDLFDTPTSVVTTLRQAGRNTICYMSAGSWEDWRPDAGDFPASVRGTSNGWPGEKWLDIRRIDVLGPIMEARLDLCAAKGFDGVEFDNIDGYTNSTGFPLTGADQRAYNRFLANAAHERGLAAGYKNNVDQAAGDEPYFEFAVNEECFQWDECDTLSVFIANDKPVFHVEYDIATTRFCPTTTALGFSSMRKRLNLDAWRDLCP